MITEVTLKLFGQIIKEVDEVTEVKVTNAKDYLHPEVLEFDILILDSNIPHRSMQLLDDILAEYDNVTMEVDLYNHWIRIFEENPEEEEASV